MHHHGCADETVARLNISNAGRLEIIMAMGNDNEKELFEKQEKERAALAEMYEKERASLAKKYEKERQMLTKMYEKKR